MRETKKSILEDQVIKADSFIVIRCDGRRFSKLKENGNFNLPYDKGFHEKMVKITDKALSSLFCAGMAYTISDEISFVLPREFNMYNRRIEKLLSVVAGYLSGEGSLEFYELGLAPVSFDAKIFEFDSIAGVLEYLDERKNSGFRNFVHTIARDMYMAQGHTSTITAKKMNGMSTRKQIEILMKEDIDIYKMNHWKREGDLLYFQEYVKTVKVGSFGTRESTQVTRRRLIKTKPLRFCKEDAGILNFMIKSEYRGD